MLTAQVEIWQPWRRGKVKEKERKETTGIKIETEFYSIGCENFVFSSHVAQLIYIQDL